MFKSKKLIRTDFQNQSKKIISYRIKKMKNPHFRREMGLKMDSPTIWIKIYMKKKAEEVSRCTKARFNFNAPVQESSEIPQLILQRGKGVSSRQQQISIH